jgi:hypothetical protein
VPFLVVYYAYDKNFKMTNWEETLQLEFNKWFHDNYGTYSFRSEAFYTDCEVEDIKTRQSIMYNWISSAFLSGYECAMYAKLDKTYDKIEEHLKETDELLKEVDEYLEK